jgi:hypothetical protein
MANRALLDVDVQLGNDTEPVTFAGSTRRSSPGARKRERIVCGVSLGVSVVLNVLCVCLAIVYVYLLEYSSSGSGGASSATGGGGANAFNGTCPFSDESILGKPNVSVVEVGSQSLSVCWTRHSHNSRVRNYAYELQRDDWFSNDTALSPVYLGNFRGVVLHGLLPATTYRLRLVAHSGDLYAADGSEPHASDVVTVTTAGAPACGNAADLAAQRHFFRTMKSDIQGCLIKALFNKQVAAQCIVESLQFSSACAMCWVDEGECAAGQCAASCIKDPAGEECDACAREKCFGPLEACSGLPDWSFPA